MCISTYYNKVFIISFIFVLFLAPVVFGQHNAISQQQFTIYFKKEAPFTYQKELLNQLGAKNYFQISPGIFNLEFNQPISSLKTTLKNNPLVQFVGDVYEDKNGNFASVRPFIFFKINSLSSLEGITSYLRSEGINLVQPYSFLPHTYKVEMAANNDPVKLCEKLKMKADIIWAEPDFVFNPYVNSNDPIFNRQWALENNGTAIQGSGISDADMDVPEAWAVTTGNSNIKISIVDSGVDTLHPDLITNILPGYDALGDSTDGFPTPNFDEDGHGTCCAGIVAAVKDNAIGVAGVAPSCKIIPVRAFYYISTGSDVIPVSSGEAFSAAISWSWQQGNADVLSNSWGLPLSLLGILPGGTQIVNDAIAMAATQARNGKGIIMLFSSGNENDSLGPIWPANLEQTVAVNATSMCDERKNPDDCSTENWGGNWGGNLDFSAPGVWVPSTDMQGSNGFTSGSYYNAFNGTSAACPNAAGVAALVLSLREELRAMDVRAILSQSCDKPTYDFSQSKEHGFWCNELGYGRVNALNAVTLAQSYVMDIPQLENKFLVYPNPAKDLLYIKGLKGQEKITIFDLNGKKLHEGSAAESQNIPTKFLNCGMYLLQITNEKNTFEYKLLIER